jgi:hypothetical protein
MLGIVLLGGDMHVKNHRGKVRQFTAASGLGVLGAFVLEKISGA